MYILKSNKLTWKTENWDVNLWSHYSKLTMQPEKINEFNKNNLGMTMYLNYQLACFFIPKVNHLTGKLNNNWLMWYILIPKKKVNSLLEKLATCWFCERTRTHVVIYNVQRKGSVQSASFQINFGNQTEKFLRLCFFI